jgi:Xaa-Pro aminopeptidase
VEYGNDPNNFRSGKTRNGVNVIIRREDIINCDSDIMILGVETDSKQHAYVLQNGEEDVPDDLKEALRIVNDIQDEIRKVFIAGRTAHEIHEAAERIPRNPHILIPSNSDHSAEIDMEDYGFHPPPMFIRRFTENGLLFSRGTYVTGIGIGYKEHPLLSPDLKLHYNTIYAFEPDTRVKVDGWDEDGLEIGVNQLAIFTENGLEYLDRPMLDWHVVK